MEIEVLTVKGIPSLMNKLIELNTCIKEKENYDEYEGILLVSNTSLDFIKSRNLLSFLPPNALFLYKENHKTKPRKWKPERNQFNSSFFFQLKNSENSKCEAIYNLNIHNTKDKEHSSKKLYICN